MPNTHAELPHYLITGGTGYIGSHTASVLLAQRMRVTIVDNLSNSSRATIHRLQTISGQKIRFIETDLLNTSSVAQLFETQDYDGVIHFAGAKAVAESSNKPINYYLNNVAATANLCKAMSEAQVKKLIFSSSATVYGSEAPVPYTEKTPRGQTSNPYGTTKAVIERMLEELCQSDPEWSVVSLRYFNPIGAHPSGLIGESPRGVPNNLMPYLTQVAIGKREKLQIFGDDYPTQDGTCQRDYIHVMDLAEGHAAAIKKLDQAGAHIFNLGTGTPISVLELVNRFIHITGVDVPYNITSRRPGDLPAFWAQTTKANSELGWRAKRSLDDMIRDSWHWQTQNPNGYG